MTEHETLVKLITDAIKTGDKVQADLARLGNISEEIMNVLKESEMLYDSDDIGMIQLIHKTVLGIDGSFQLAGGAGGSWYAPISVARIIYKDGIESQPFVHALWAGIEEILEQDDPKPNIVATVKMLSGETKAILDWGSLGLESLVFIDGPIVDPPVLGIGGKDYVKERCDAMKVCLDKSLVVGCVKRSRDRFYIEHISKKFPLLADKLRQFPSDQHLFAHIFARIRRDGKEGPLFTGWVNLSGSTNDNAVNSTYQEYKKDGVFILSFFFQKGIMSQVLRLDVPFLRDISENVAEAEERFLYLAKACDNWIYPGQDYPIPVYLAHEKCNIREGAAEVLYDEIMTKGRSTDPWNQLVLSQLR